MNVIRFNVIMLIATFAAIVIFVICSAIRFTTLRLLSNAARPATFVARATDAFNYVFQCYLWGLWSAICVAVALRFVGRSDVAWGSAYWVMAFVWASTPLGVFALRTSNTVGVERARGIRTGILMFYTVVLAAFFFFAIAHGAMEAPYGWALSLLGFADVLAL